MASLKDKLKHALTLKWPVWVWVIVAILALTGLAYLVAKAG